MKRFYMLLALAPVSGLIALPLTGTAHAANVVGASGLVANTSSSQSSTSFIPRAVMHSQQLKAEATVLNTTTNNIQAAHKSKTFKKLLSAAGMSRKVFMVKVAQQLQIALEAMGYSQSQIIITKQHHVIMRLRHEEKHEKNLR